MQAQAHQPSNACWHSDAIPNGTALYVGTDLEEKVFHKALLAIQSPGTAISTKYNYITYTYIYKI